MEYILHNFKTFVLLFTLLPFQRAFFSFKKSQVLILQILLVQK